jgi:16S rRNA (guanine966-N2)-methyltransferase
MRMRIISGSLKGRYIKVPDSKLIRPTTDMVRETMFNLINNKIDFDNIKVLDLYSGSGSLGFECLSRGASQIHFVEKNYVIYKNLEDNIKSLDVSAECTIYRMEALKFTENIRNKYNLILADPPFFKDDVYKVIKNILNNGFLEDEDSIIFIERSIQTREKDTANFETEPFKIIGDACLYEIRKGIVNE